MFAVRGLLWRRYSRVYTAQAWLAEARAVITLVVVCAAVALVAATVVTRRRLIRADRIRSTLSLGGPLTGAALRDALRGLVGDPGLEVYYRLPRRAEYVTAAGTPPPWSGPPSAAPARRLLEAGARDDDGRTALVDIADAPGRHPRALRLAVLEAAIPAIENARLQASLRHQLNQLALARSRTVRAFLAERRRLEGQLHDGTQACLYEARSQVRRAKPKVGDAAVAAVVDGAAAMLDNAIRELGALVRGIYPAGLRETGLGSALFVATAEFPIAVEIDDDTDRDVDEVTATAAFFTVMDVLYIAARSGARLATVRLSTTGETLQLRITYEPTPADQAAASPGGKPDETDAWLAIEDRVHAVDATMRVTQTLVPKTGLTNENAVVTAEVEMPCAS
jgi:signal transduction histidine kinase